MQIKADQTTSIRESPDVRVGIDGTVPWAERAGHKSFVNVSSSIFEGNVLPLFGRKPRQALGGGGQAPRAVAELPVWL